MISIRSSARPLGRLATLGLLFLCSALAATVAAAAPQDRQALDEIRAAAVAALGAGDAQSAEAILDPRLRLAACSQALQAVASGPKTAQVRCADTPGWRLYVPCGYVARPTWSCSVPRPPPAYHSRRPS